MSFHSTRSELTQTQVEILKPLSTLILPCSSCIAPQGPNSEAVVVPERRTHLRCSASIPVSLSHAGNLWKATPSCLAFVYLDREFYKCLGGHTTKCQITPQHFFSPGFCSLKQLLPFWFQLCLWHKILEKQLLSKKSHH